ncbi:MAG: YHS domain-containing protein, partial [Polaromonas sp.]
MDLPSKHNPVGHSDHGHGVHGAASGRDGPLKDPVCGMTVTTASQHHLEHDGRSFYFCSAKCKSKFEAAPATYTTNDGAAGSEAPEASEPADPGTIYTCPMHPEIRQDHPGN